MRADPAASTSSLDVLIVDDNEDAAMSLTMLLELEDISVAAAPDGPSALQMLEQTAPRLMLIDIGLPGMNGFELAKRIRERDGSTPTLIALTGREADASGDPEAARFDQFWTKPFDPKRLLVEVKTLLGRGE